MLHELWTPKARRLIEEVCFFLLTEVMQRQNQSLALNYLVRLSPDVAAADRPRVKEQLRVVLRIKSVPHRAYVSFVSPSAR